MLLDATGCRTNEASRLEKLNHIRICVMYPVKNIDVTDEDFSFVRKFLKDFKLWQEMTNELYE
jgi:hypothetical protein